MSPTSIPSAAAQGVAEFSTDGLKGNTVGGWREIRQSVFCKRPAAAPAAAGEWADRPLEEPTARVAICQIARCDRIGASWRNGGWGLFFVGILQQHWLEEHEVHAERLNGSYQLHNLPHYVALWMNQALGRPESATKVCYLGKDRR